MSARLYSAFTNVREYFTPVPTGPSTFKETGNITAAEFITAGDYLVSKFPTWTWYPLSPLYAHTLTTLL
jgi:ubiquitin-like-conjugating enzyme ATG3